MVIQLHSVRQLGGDMVDSVKSMLGKCGLDESGVAQIASDACELGRGVFIAFEIDIDDGGAFAEETPFEHTAEESGTACNQNVGHGICHSIVQNGVCEERLLRGGYPFVMCQIIRRQNLPVGSGERLIIQSHTGFGLTDTVHSLFLNRFHNHVCKELLAG